jgi:hypothetical protein
LPYSTLSKRWNALSYHRIREAIAAGYIRYEHIPGVDNVANILTKALAHAKARIFLDPLLFWKGDPSLCKIPALRSKLLLNVVDFILHLLGVFWGPMSIFEYAAMRSQDACDTAPDLGRPEDGGTLVVAEQSGIHVDGDTQQVKEMLQHQLESGQAQKSDWEPLRNRAIVYSFDPGATPAELHSSLPCAAANLSFLESFAHLSIPRYIRNVSSGINDGRTNAVNAECTNGIIQPASGRIDHG